jgi:LEA14-like dessication related protein
LAGIGDDITFYCGNVPGEASIYFNDIKMIGGQSSASYKYTIKRDLDVRVYVNSSHEANMFITEIPEDKTTVKVTMLEDLPAS